MQSVTLTMLDDSVTIDPPQGWEVIVDRASNRIEMVQGDQRMQVGLLGPIKEPEVAWQRYVTQLASAGIAVAHDPSTGECVTIESKKNARGTCGYTSQGTQMLTVLATSPDSGPTVANVIESARFTVKEEA